MAPERGSWVPGADGSGFGIEHLPYGVIRRASESPRVAVRIGAWALDVAEVVEAGLVSVPGLSAEVLRAPALNGFLALGPRVWSDTRAGVISLLDGSGGG
ncbi:MAG: fumarylacetoacetase, partial [Solirubrobacteraceae bacterium]|nr:fumarylacetoacetase [Solirubrobacteraceae bacterium]